LQVLFLVILIGALGAGLLALAWMGVAQRRRRRRLARVGGRMGLKFSPADPFDLTRRYAGFVLASAGHSPRAENVLYGRYDRWALRAFDFYFEAGHGPRRLARRYSVIAADTDLPLPAALIWHAGDREHVPLRARGPAPRVGPWRAIAGGAFCRRLSEAFGAFAETPAHVQTLGASVLVCSVGPCRPADLPDRIAQAAGALAALRARGGPD